MSQIEAEKQLDAAIEAVYSAYGTDLGKFFSDVLERNKKTVYKPTNECMLNLIKLAQENGWSGESPIDVFFRNHIEELRTEIRQLDSDYRDLSWDHAALAGRHSGSF